MINHDISQLIMTNHHPIERGTIVNLLGSSCYRQSIKEVKVGQTCKSTVFGSIFEAIWAFWSTFIECGINT